MYKWYKVAVKKKVIFYVYHAWRQVNNLLLACPASDVHEIFANYVKVGLL